MIDLLSLYRQLFPAGNTLADMALDLKQEQAFRRIGTLFAQNGVPFCPLKGADLAWRVYPKGMLRPKCDLDLLIRQEDMKKALVLLAADGWQMPYRYRTSRHEGMTFRSGIALELHFNLPGSQLPPEQVWPELRPGENGRCQLPFELNLLMLFNHTLEHHWFNGRRLVMDAACLVQKEGIPDWAAVRNLADRFRMASPELLFAAFPEYFPEAARPQTPFAAEVCGAFRDLVLNSETPFEGREERILSGGRKNCRWWLDRLRGMSPSSIRLQTDNPQGHYGKLLLGYWQVGMRKWKKFLGWQPTQIDPDIRERLQKEALVAGALKSQPR